MTAFLYLLAYGAGFVSGIWLGISARRAPVIDEPAESSDPHVVIEFEQRRRAAMLATRSRR